MSLVISGATGKLGKRTIHHLINTFHASPKTIIALTRNPSTVPQEISSSGIEVRKADFSQPTKELAEALKGADRFLLTSTDTMDDQKRLKDHFNAIDAAKLAGVKHIYYTSLAFPGQTSNVSVTLVQRAHLLTEAYIKESGLSYTILREGVYADAWPLFLGYFDAQKYNGEELYIAGDGRIAWTAREDLAIGNASILNSAVEEYKNKTVLLTSEETLTLEEVARIVEKYFKRAKLNVKVVDVKEFVERNSHLTGTFATYSGPFTQSWATTYDGLRRGEGSETSPLLNQLIAKYTKPTPFESVVKTMIPQ